MANHVEHLVMWLVISVSSLGELSIQILCLLLVIYPFIRRFCYREEPNLTTCLICFFYLNLCFLLPLFTKRILSIHNGLPRGTLSLCLKIKPKCLCSGKYPDPVHLWMAARNKKLTHPLPEAGHSRRYLQILWPFLLYFLISSPSLFYKRSWHPDPDKMVIWRL